MIFEKEISNFIVVNRQVLLDYKSWELGNIYNSTN